MHTNSTQPGAAPELATPAKARELTPKEAELVQFVQNAPDLDKNGMIAFVRLSNNNSGARPLSPEKILASCRDLDALLATLDESQHQDVFNITRPVLLLALAIAEEQTRGYEIGVSECEHDLMAWLKHGEQPAAAGTDLEFVLDSLDPKGGGSTLEKVNRQNRVWWLSMKRLQARLLEFAALEIPEPQEIIEADVETMRREIEEGGLS